MLFSWTDGPGWADAADDAWYVDQWYADAVRRREDEAPAEDDDTS